jgi:Permease for cytosine/purines, uracil, thiamine, allantoin
VALPLTMTLYAFIGVAVTSATMVIYGQAVADPIELLGRFHSPVAVIISLLAVLLATLNVNIGANVVSPANDFSNLWPRRISFKVGGLITCFVGIAMMPWKLLANHQTFIFGWLNGYAAVLGPVAGIMICDYFVIRRKILLPDDLYLRGGAYEYSHGFNWRAVAALIIGSAVALMGLVIPQVRSLYDYSWFVGFVVAFAVYWAVMPQFASPYSKLDETEVAYSRDLVVAKVNQCFKYDAIEVLKILDLCGLADKRGRERLQIAILKLSGGKLEKLQELVIAANTDYRDILAWAEYPEQMKRDTWKMSPEEVKQIRDRDRKQYLDWLNRNP